MLHKLEKELPPSYSEVLLFNETRMKNKTTITCDSNSFQSQSCLSTTSGEYQNSVYTSSSYLKKNNSLGNSMICLEPPRLVTNLNQLAEIPEPIICPFCLNNIITSVSFDIGFSTWLLAGIVCALGYFFCLSLKLY